MPNTATVSTLADGDSGGFFIAMAVLVLIGGLIGAIILRAAAHWVVKMDVPFGRAFVTALLGALASYGAQALFSAILGPGAKPAGRASSDQQTAAAVGAFIVGVLAQAGIICLMLRIKYGKALLVALAMFVISLLIIAVFLGVLYAVGVRVGSPG